MNVLASVIVLNSPNLNDTRIQGYVLKSQMMESIDYTHSMIFDIILIIIPLFMHNQLNDGWWITLYMFKRSKT